MKEKFIIYQVLPRLFGNGNTTNKENGTVEENGTGKMSAFTPAVLKKIRDMGFTHIWYTGVIEHATRTDYSRFNIRNSTPGIVKGNAGSPYAIRDYYTISPDLADDVPNRMKEFEELVERTHQAGMKVLIDFVPNHLAREYSSNCKPERVKEFGAADDTDKAFSPRNNFYYLPGQPLELDWDAGYGEYPAKVSGNDCFNNHPSVCDWYETVKLNYGVDYNDHNRHYFDPIPDTWNKMREILAFWTKKGVDGFRCDMAEMVPVDFWHWVIPQVKKRSDNSPVFIAEIYKPELCRDYIHYGHFDYLYDKVGLYDTLRNVINGCRPASDITACWQSLDDIHEHMVNFLENHDEQRIASEFFAGDPFKALPAMVVSATMNINPVMVYMGQELGEKGMDKEGFSCRDGRTTIFDYWCVATLHSWRNNGKYDGKNLDEDQKRLKAYYVKLLNICNTEKAIREGGFYDLMYLNCENPDFDPAKQYAFCRHTPDSLILVIANFGGEKDVNVNVGTAVLEYMNINGSDMSEAKDLLSCDKFRLDGNWPESLSVPMKTYSARVIKFETKPKL